MRVGASADAPSPPLWGRVGEGGGGRAQREPEYTGFDNAPSSEPPALHARQPPSALGLRPSRSSPTWGEGRDRDAS
jgi:hypothetical protein